MYYQHSITILSDGKTVTAQNNKTGTQAIARCSPEDEFKLSIGASLAIERLLEKDAEIIAGDHVQFTENFDPMYVSPYAATFVDTLPISSFLKAKYCYSVTRPPLKDEYVVIAVCNKTAYIQTVSGCGRCYVVSTIILKKVAK